MATGRQLIQAALRSPMEAAGWRARAAGWFTKPAADSAYTRVAVVSTASKRAAPGTADATWFAGLRDERVEPVVAMLSGVKDGGYRQRTVVTPIGYLWPRHATCSTK